MVAPISFALAVNLSNSLPVAPLTALTCDIAASKSLYVSIVSFNPILTPRTAPTCKIGFFRRFITPRIGAVARSTAFIVTLQVFLPKLVRPPLIVDNIGEILSFASNSTEYFSFAHDNKLFCVFCADRSNFVTSSFAFFADVLIWSVELFTLSAASLTLFMFFSTLDVPGPVLSSTSIGISIRIVSAVLLSSFRAF